MMWFPKMGSEYPRWRRLSLVALTVTQHSCFYCHSYCAASKTASFSRNRCHSWWVLSGSNMLSRVTFSSGREGPAQWVSCLSLWPKVALTHNHKWTYPSRKGSRLRVDSLGNSFYQEWVCAQLCPTSDDQIISSSTNCCRWIIPQMTTLQTD